MTKQTETTTMDTAEMKTRSRQPRWNCDSAESGTHEKTRERVGGSAEGAPSKIDGMRRAKETGRLEH
eukprot:164996-Pleurochrysis_carterae.AAC.1